MEYSFGIIPLRKGLEGVDVFLIRNYEDKYLFPKGHRSGDESPQQAAERELFEETGLVVERYLSIVPFKESYFVCREGKNIPKEVLYYAAFVSGSIVIQEEEIAGGEWVSLLEAEKKCSFPGLQKMVRLVRKSLP